MRNELMLAHIQGLLEGWGVEWDDVPSLVGPRKYRVLELAQLLNPLWVVRYMANGLESDKKLLNKLSELIY